LLEANQEFQTLAPRPTHSAKRAVELDGAGHHHDGRLLPVAVRVHHLGNLTYGVWVIIMSLVSYMNLLDLGCGGGYSFRFQRTAQQNHEESSRAVSGALWIRLWISVAIIAAGLLASAAFNHVFTIPSELQQTARIAVLITAVTVASISGVVYLAASW